MTDLFSPQVFTAPLQVYNVDGVFREVADVLHWVTTSYWFLDVPASFLTAVYINDILHSRLADVAKAYFKAWFWFLGDFQVQDFRFKARSSRRQIEATTSVNVNIFFMEEWKEQDL